MRGCGANGKSRGDISAGTATTFNEALSQELLIGQYRSGTRDTQVFCKRSRRREPLPGLEAAADDGFAQPLVNLSEQRPTGLRKWYY